jgi:hypothetical protein
MAALGSGIDIIPESLGNGMLTRENRKNKEKRKGRERRRGFL